MKIYKKTSKRWLAGMGAACLLLLLLSSCVKENSSYYAPQVSYLSFIQASPDEPAIDFYLNNNLVNKTGPIVYGSTLDYVYAYTGTRTVNIYKQGTTTKLFSDTVSLKPNLAYSLFLANVAAHPDLVLLTDSITRPSASNATIRFVNVSPDAPAADLAIQGGAVIVSNKPYKGSSSFISVPANKTYTFEVRQTGTNTVLATLSNANVVGGTVYTVWLHGLASSVTATTKLTADIITNASY